eukprot:m.96244 g.96244  ORF g.96244 m.96244 type:complete len:1284 (-) comp13538_c0_seq1:326-4177(-)
MDTKFRFAIDRGGTFTDIYAECPGGKVHVMKLLSEDPDNYPDAPREGIRRILQEYSGQDMPKDQPVDDSLIEWIRMGTTVATNALLERKGEPEALVITEGFRDILHIGNQARPRIFDLKIQVPDVLYEHVVQASERLILDDEGDIEGSTGERLTLEKPLDKEQLKTDLQAVYDKGIRSLAVVLMHSYLYPKHEHEVGEIAKSIGFTQVSLSSEVMRMAKLVPRGFTACADAYLTPCIKRYVDGFTSGFKNDLKDVSVLFMQSDGGLTPVQSFTGSRAILSGPAGGVVGYAATAFDPETKKAVIGFDMGGTSTDVSRYAGSLDHVFESTTAGVTIQAPQLDINTVAAGGGSQLFFRAGMFVVGPESAGAHPGPACYRKGGPLTITDANVLLGRIQPKHFPHIFGESENEPLDFEASKKAFVELTANINASLQGKTMTTHEVALGFVQVANEAMCRPIRSLTQAKGHDTTNHILSCFGGAGGQHACAIARSLGISKIAVHRYSGILSAFGLALADVVHEEQGPWSAVLAEPAHMELWNGLQKLCTASIAKLTTQGFTENQIYLDLFLNLRYQGTDCLMMTSPCDGQLSISEMAARGPALMKEFSKKFESMYNREFGFLLDGRDILVNDIRVRAIGKHTPTPRPGLETSDTKPEPFETCAVTFQEGTMDTPLYRLDSLLSGATIPGPAILLEKNSTILVEPDCVAHLNKYGDVEIIIGEGRSKNMTTELDSIYLSIFSHRFMSIAEQMGRSLQRTSISVNIKERLDFSCALFSPDGGLVANAPHVPVHLGAMQEAVRFQIQHCGETLKPGDVLLSNHPAAGGSHLPDLTVITPVFREGVSKPIFFVASRGHHADIGGITPGSMPPHSISLSQEGAAIVSFKLVDQGKFQEDGITNILNEPAKIENSSGTRNLRENLSDLRAQIAANQRGITLVNELIDECGLEVVLAYMKHIQENAESAVREVLQQVAKAKGVVPGTSTAELFAEDFMDDGSPICLRVKIDANTGNASFDFTGTGDEIYGNINAPRAVTYSAIIYCMRCMVGYDIPLNQGCINPIDIHIPKGCFLYPSDGAAVVGGNVLTSQRVTDVILRAFEACAASQGCMNNITFGDASVGYYETVAGGAGAGPTWNGRSGVHTHMTNTRITDPEILERHYPVILEQFMLRDGSGGDGKYRGGDGVIRRLRFRRPLTLSLLTERRSFRPFGLQGGNDGQRGRNTLIRDGRNVNLGSKASIPVSKGDVFLLETPGGGGFGSANDRTSDNVLKDGKPPVVLAGGSLGKYKEAQESN